MKRTLSLILGLWSICGGAQAACRSVAVWASTPSGYMAISRNADIADVAFLDYWWINAAGSLVEHDPGWFDPATHPAPPLKALGVEVYGALASGTRATIISAITTNSATFIRNITTTVQTLGLDGMHLDLEWSGIASDRTNYSAFVTNLATALHANGKKLSVYSYGYSADSGMNSGVFNWGVLAVQADRLDVGSYDEFWDPAQNPGAPDNPNGFCIQDPAWFGAIVDYIQSKPYSAKVFPGVAAYGFRWVNGIFQPSAPLTYSQIKLTITAHGGAPVWDAARSEWHYSYIQGPNQTDFWYTEKDSVDAMAAVIVAKNHPGIFIFQAGGEDADPNGTTNGLWDKLRTRFCTLASPTPTSTRTSTPTVSRTRTPSPTSSPSRSPSPTRSVSPSPSATPTGSRTASPSPTASPSYSPSPTRSVSPSPSATPTGSRTASPSPTASPSYSPSPTRSVSPSPSATPSISVTNTATPTDSPTSTETPVFSATVTPSLSPSLSASTTPTASFSVSVTPTWSLTASVTPSRTSTVSVSVSVSVSPSLSASPSATRSATTSLTPTPSATKTSTPSSTLTFTRTVTVVATPSSTATMSVTVNASATPSPSLSPTPVLIASATLSPTPPRGKKGVPKPLQIVAVPNPQSGPDLSLSIELDADADTIELRLYSVAMNLIQSAEMRGPFSAGWSHVRTPFPAQLSGGLYYVLVLAKTDAGDSARSTHSAKVVYLP